MCGSAQSYLTVLQVLLSMGFSRQEYWSLSFPPPGDLPNPGIKFLSLSLQVDSLPLELSGESQLLNSLFLKINYLSSLSVCLATQSCPTLCDPLNCSPQGSSGSWGFSRQEYWSVLPWPLPGDLPKSRIKCTSPKLQADSLPSEPSAKPKNTGVSVLSLHPLFHHLSIPGNFPTQESNWGFPQCQWILLPGELPGKTLSSLMKICSEKKKIFNIHFYVLLVLFFPPPSKKVA